MAAWEGIASACAFYCLTYGSQGIIPYPGPFYTEGYFKAVNQKPRKEIGKGGLHSGLFIYTPINKAKHGYHNGFLS
jgi:hypothetical protein